MPVIKRQIALTAGFVGYATLQNTLDNVHISVYRGPMKKRDLEKALRRIGWAFLRHGKRHDIWTDGDREEAIPRHNEINEKLARAILRRTERRI
jgi:mRNA interferase HicA